MKTITAAILASVLTGCLVISEGPCNGVLAGLREGPMGYFAAIADASDQAPHCAVRVSEAEYRRLIPLLYGDEPTPYGEGQN